MIACYWAGTEGTEEASFSDIRAIVDDVKKGSGVNLGKWMAEDYEEALRSQKNTERSHDIIPLRRTKYAHLCGMTGWRYWSTNSTWFLKTRYRRPKGESEP
jgi:hypothetical protein